MCVAQINSARHWLVALLLLPGYLSGASQPSRVVWQKDLTRGPVKSHRIEVSATGKARYELKQSGSETLTVDFQLKPHTVDFLLQLFTQADFLNQDKNFVSSRRVADTGTRTIRLESGRQTREVVFLYTEDKTLRKIVAFFDQLSGQEKFLLEMNLALKHDRLGIPKKLNQLERFLHRKTIVDPQRFAPILKKISLDMSLMNLARKEARRLLRQINR